jgi:small multidrug resistance pump
MPNSVDKYKFWFYMAAIYNLLWGLMNILFPRIYLNFLGLEIPEPLAYWRAIGMFVLVFAPAYWWAAKYPELHYHLILIGFIGKLFGPVGFLYNYIDGSLPKEFFFVILTNDLIWWPIFVAYLYENFKKYGVTNLLSGSISLD